MRSWVVNGLGGALRFRVLGGWWERLRGLLGTREDAMPVVLLGCSSVHTFGMRYPIDVAFASRHGEVLSSRRAVPPGRVVGCRRAWCAFERPASAGPWMEEGGSVLPRGGQDHADGPACGEGD